MKAERQEQDFDFPYGWNRGDTCVMITNKAKKSTCEYTVESYDGRYFGVRSHTGLFHRASPQRLFHSKVPHTQGQNWKCSASPVFIRGEAD